MPPLIHEEESETDMPRKSPKKGKAHTETTVEADVHAKDQLKDELMDDIEANEGAKAAKEEKTRISPTASNADDEENGDSDEDDEEAYEVEAIIGHEFRRRGKGKPILLYNVKWKGYDESENTLEPEENLISSRDLLAKYHHSIGGYPQPEAASSTKKKRPKSNAHESAASATEGSPIPPPSKRQKQTKTEDGETSDVDESTFGSWVPKGPNWDSEIKTIETVERDQASNDLYILLLFKNGKKSRVKNGLMRKKAPQSLLNFYEAHLNFSTSSA